MLRNNNRKLFYFILFIICIVPTFYLLLFFTWYKEQFTGSFHFFDDSREWLGMDKGGHYVTAFVESWIFLAFYQWKSKQDSLIQDYAYKTMLCFAGSAGFFLQLPIEFLDGYSAGYGFSWYDCAANLAGACTATVQYWYWGKIKIIPKVSFWPSEFAALRPNLLGYNVVEQFIKDYNGLTYWCSFSPNIFFRRAFLPAWFHIAIGYGADGLLGGHDNMWTDEEGKLNDYTMVPRIGFIYLSLDINVMAIPLKNKWLGWVIGILNVIKVPIPAFVISSF